MSMKKNNFSFNLIEKKFQYELENYQLLYNAQPAQIRNHLHQQGKQIVQDILDGLSWIQFSFPEYIYLTDGVDSAWNKCWIAPRYRQQQVGHRLLRHFHIDIIHALLERFDELQSSSHQAVVFCVRLLRFLMAKELLATLSNGEQIIRLSKENKIPSLSQFSDHLISLRISFLNSSSETMSRVDRSNQLDKISTDQVFTNDGLQKLHHSDDFPEIFLELEISLRLLEIAFVIEPSIIEDPTFKQNYEFVITQYKSEGQAYARYQTMEIIRTIRERAAQNALNRGLSLSLPYFDDQALELRSYDFEVIPAGRILFEPYFVVQAAEEAKSRVSAERSYSESTKEHLLAELDLIQKSFAFQHHYTPVGLLLQSDGIISSRNQEARRKLTR